MICVITKQLVFLEIVELARLKIAKVLHIHPGSVAARIRSAEGKAIPEFYVAKDDCVGLNEAQIRQVIQTVYWNLKTELADRMAHIEDVRGESSPKEAQEKGS